MQFISFRKQSVDSFSADTNLEDQDACNLNNSMYKTVKVNKINELD